MAAAARTFPKVPRVYSYIRFSHIKQAEGASAERQRAYAVEWAKRAGMSLDETLTDQGLSAYSQKHITQGAFGKFLAAVKAGEVPKGSVLIVEAFDRMSRADPMEAFQQLREITLAGLKVVTARDNQEYSAASFKATPMALLQCLMAMILANQESVNKGGRVADSLRRKCEGWVAGTYRGPIHVGAMPGWLRFANGKYEPIPAQVAVIRRAAALYRNGSTATQIAKTLHAEGLKIGTRTRPTASHVIRMLTYPALAGDKTVEVKRETEHGEIGHDAFELKDYFPPVMSRAELAELQQISRQRTRKFIRGEIPSLLTGFGIALCGYCGAPLRAHTLLSQRKDDGTLLPSARRLMCSHENHGSGCKRNGSCSAVPVEIAVMEFLSSPENLRKLVGSDRSSLRRSELALAEAELAATEDTLERAADLALASRSDVGVFVERVRKLETARDAAREKVQRAGRALMDAARDMTGVDEQWREVKAGVLALNYESRMAARQLTADIFERIAVYHSGVEDPAPAGERVIVVEAVAKGGDKAAWLYVRHDGTLLRKLEWVKLGKMAEAASEYQAAAVAPAPASKKRAALASA